ncbi:MAG: hypothetical protein HZB91_02880 [Elusimicrobia bacterium]|nr:hypothetical protein [Elusimicrobiota bacterium]
MEPVTALQSLLVWAHLMGVNAVPARLPQVEAVAFAPAAADAKPILTVPLKDVIAEQDRAVAWQEVGRGSIGFGVGLDPEAGLWVKFRQDRVRSAHALAALEGGVVERFPVESYKFVLENGNVRAFPVQEPQTPQAIVSVPAMLRQAYNLAAHVLFTPVDYAVLYEPETQGSAIPASVSLIREDQAGNFWVTYGKASETAAAIKWFVAINGVMYGMKLEAPNLVFYSKPVPPVALESEQGLSAAGPVFLLPESRLPR